MRIEIDKITPLTFGPAVDNLDDQRVTTSMSYDRTSPEGKRVIAKNLHVDYGNTQYPVAVMFFPDEKKVRIVQFPYSDPSFFFTAKAVEDLNRWTSRQSPRTGFQVYRDPNGYLALVLEKATTKRSPYDLRDWIRDVVNFSPLLAARIDQVTK